MLGLHMQNPFGSLKSLSSKFGSLDRSSSDAPAVPTFRPRVGCSDSDSFLACVSVYKKGLALALNDGTFELPSTEAEAEEGFHHLHRLEQVLSYQINNTKLTEDAIRLGLDERSLVLSYDTEMRGHS